MSGVGQRFPQFSLTGVVSNDVNHAFQSFTQDSNRPVSHRPDGHARVGRRAQLIAYSCPSQLPKKIVSPSITGVDSTAPTLIMRSTPMTIWS